LGKIEKKSKRKKKDLKFHPDGIVNGASHRTGISERKSLDSASSAE
jgi:hypothetical protein